MTTKEMFKTPCKPGYWFVNVARVDESPRWVQQPKPVDTTGTLFGYEARAFMARQYR